MENVTMEYETIDQYFADHPDEEAAYYDDMATLAQYDEMVELPEDWAC